MTSTCTMTTVQLLMIVLVTVLHVEWAKGESCKILDGAWHNQLGSEMILNHTAAGELIGEYRTAVERASGAAGYSLSKVVGAAPYNSPGAAIGFAVMFSQGASLSVWTGQCLVCYGEEVLVSSWLLREKVDTCIDKWKSTRIGQDMFTRTEQTSGPRKDQGTHSPAQGSYSIDNTLKTLPPGRHSRSLDIPCGLVGVWYNEMGSEVILQHNADNTITGEYRTAVERSRGSAGTSHSKVYGVGNVHDAATTFAIFVVWRNGMSVTGWVGQCHLCGENKTETLEVNWLLRSQIDTCDNNWKATGYGQNSFTRHPRAPGPRKHLDIHTPLQDGEVDGSESLQLNILTCKASGLPVSFVLVILLNLLIWSWS